jgi:PhzF family phenazine biosynthesis protein
LAGEAQAILSSLGLTLDDLQPGLFPTVVNTGNSFLVVPLKNEAALANIKLHRAQVVAISRQYGLIGFYPYAAADGENIQATTRMFGPYYGIEEEAGTGMAAGPLACFLYQFANKKRKRYLIEQGRFMDLPSRSLLHVHLKVEDGVIRNLFVGGDAFVKEERTIEI